MTEEEKTTDPLRRGGKFMSLVLRHQPLAAGLALDAAGWTEIEALVRGAPARLNLSAERIARIVAENDKQRFQISEDGKRVRAVQGHSIDVDLPLEPITPPEVLFHGTATRFLEAILAEGLKLMKRRYVHLSADRETARKVGARHGMPVILRIAAAEAHADGLVFRRAENGVWLTDPLAPRYLTQEA